jgi:hypothetical protein
VMRMPSWGPTGRTGRTARTARRSLPLICAGLLSAALPLVGSSSFAQQTAGASAPTSAPATAQSDGKEKNKKKSKKKGKAKVAPPSSSADAPKPTTAKRRKVGAAPVYLVGDANAHLINENAPKIVAFPQEAKAVEKAFAETRRDQLVDAEKAARDAKSPDRWRTVLFMLRGLHDRTDPEACFWRVLSFYRLSELDRARAVRDGCEMPAKDSATLNTEDALVAGIPAMGTVAREDQFAVAGASGAVGTTKEAPKPASPPAAAPYTGPGPQHFPQP